MKRRLGAVGLIAVAAMLGMNMPPPREPEPIEPPPPPPPQPDADTPAARRSVEEAYAAWRRGRDARERAEAEARKPRVNLTREQARRVRQMARAKGGA